MYGVGVAVANALTEVKQVADHVTLSNDEDGVAEFMESRIINLNLPKRMNGSDIKLQPLL